MGCSGENTNDARGYDDMGIMRLIEGIRGGEGSQCRFPETRNIYFLPVNRALPVRMVLGN